MAERSRAKASRLACRNRVFWSRSEAIRGLVRLGIENLAQASDILKAVERLFEVEKMRARCLIDHVPVTIAVTSP